MSRVLVVEDEAHIRELIQLHLGLEGLEIEAVGDGVGLQALEAKVQLDQLADVRFVFNDENS